MWTCLIIISIFLLNLLFKEYKIILNKIIVIMSNNLHKKLINKLINN